MKKILLLSVVACTMIAVVAFLPEKKRKLIWSDEFNRVGTPDSTHWGYDLGDGCQAPSGCGWGNNEKEFYTKNPKNVRIENGHLIIEAHREQRGESQYTSTRIVSKHKGDWQYGKIEIRAKLPKGRGVWPAIWMLSTDEKHGGWPGNGEIDIMEYVGWKPGVVHGTVHTEAYNGMKGTQKEGKTPLPDCSEQFHTYAIDWTKEKIEFMVDDKVYHSFIRNPADDYKGWPFDQRFHLIMNIAVGGGWGGAEGIDESIWPQKMEVDWVRVWGGE